MFGKKKNQIIDTELDIKIKTLWSERYGAWKDLEEAVELVIIRNGAVDIYPEGADKDRAERDVELAKENLLCAIGKFDSINNEYKDALAITEGRITTVEWAKNVITSHKIIEDVYKKFFKKTY